MEVVFASVSKLGDVSHAQQSLVPTPNWKLPRACSQLFKPNSRRSLPWCTRYCLFPRNMAARGMERDAQTPVYLTG